MFQPQLLYPRVFYLYLMASNFLLRLSWTHKLSPHLRRNQLLALFFVMLEGFRCAKARSPLGTALLFLGCSGTLVSTFCIIPAERPEVRCRPALPLLPQLFLGC